MAEAAQLEALVETALGQLTSWPGLSRSPQLTKFLNYIVRAKLKGDEASIKAYSIAVDVFGRPPTFDPQTDPIVRVQARRLRAALEEYYSGDGVDSPIRIYLPVGRYVPEFRLAGESPAEAVAMPTASVPPKPGQVSRGPRTGLPDWMLYALVLVVGVGIVVALAQVLTPRPTRIDVPRPPFIGIGEFTAISPAEGQEQGQGATGGIAGLAIELVTDLQLFDDIKP
ncbi:MAG: hypothetical protein EON93_17455, partial [Burkholderiales bacterium]